MSKQYWVGRLTNDDYWDMAIDNHLWLTQQMYGHQKSTAVSGLLGCVANVKVGDVILLTYGNCIYAYGNVLPCPFETDQVTSIKRVTERNAHYYDSGIVRFSDNEAFYEDLRNGCDSWGQRITVDQWHYYLPQSDVTTQHMRPEITQGITQMSFIGVSENSH